ncbi:hypothetical protein [Echinicola vietnamensis]|uniref:hypothetical protein n=1 Tax=Echinicola vietnamensis TaxID=390884 RepID=UPI000312F2CC|nr:hypothetical protein [Echinicola vietnamensis]
MSQGKEIVLLVICGVLINLAMLSLHYEWLTGRTVAFVLLSPVLFIVLAMVWEKSR